MIARGLRKGRQEIRRLRGTLLVESGRVSRFRAVKWIARHLVPWSEIGPTAQKEPGGQATPVITVEAEAMPEAIGEEECPEAEVDLEEVVAVGNGGGATP
jgi:hypothetical protein